jgi:hypothetical protein
VNQALMLRHGLVVLLQHLDVLLNGFTNVAPGFLDCHTIAETTG